MTNNLKSAKIQDYTVRRVRIRLRSHRIAYIQRYGISCTIIPETRKTAYTGSQSLSEAF